jgi:threonylcarbamoyladenosine tRNA methylthiotransferase MtaB
MVTMMTPHDRASRTTDAAPLRVAFHTLGCRLNQYDTEGIKVALREARPIEVVAWEDEADLYLLNSCTVTGKADQECRRLARQVKRRHPGARVVVAGCYAQTQPRSLEAVPEIDGVLGNTTKGQVERWLPAVLDAPPGGGRPVVMVEDFGKKLSFDSPIIEEFAGRSRAFVKIQDGCDLRCSYCLIWQARGPGRSRGRDEVLGQIARLHEEAGYNELVLTGVHMGAWGRDLRGRDGRLIDLLAAVCDRFPALRLRLSSIHPNEITTGLLRLMADRATLRPHLHVSLQSGSDTVLERMRRPYRSGRARRAIADAARVDPAMGLGADLIVGFPGETEAEFRDTVAMVEDLPFTYLHVFRYSPRPGTPAAALAPVHPEAVSERSRILRELAARKREAFLLTLVGQRREAVVENPDDRDASRRLATTDNYAPVSVRAELPAGTLIELEADAWRDGMLRAEGCRVLREVTA